MSLLESFDFIIGRVVEVFVELLVRSDFLEMC